MKSSRFIVIKFLWIAFALAGASNLHAAISITLSGTVSKTYAGSFYSSVSVGDPFSLKLIFDQPPLFASGSYDQSFYTAANISAHYQIGSVSYSSIGNSWAHMFIYDDSFWARDSFTFDLGSYDQSARASGGLLSKSNGQWPWENPQYWTGTGFNVIESQSFSAAVLNDELNSGVTFYHSDPWPVLSTAVDGLINRISVSNSSAIPEPSTYGLLGSGVLAASAVFFSRKKRKA